MASIRVTVYAAQAVAEARQISNPERAKIAEQAAGIARGNAPVLTGAYRGGIGVEAGGSRVAIVDTDEDAIYKEYGTSDTPAHMALTNAARQFGRYTGWQARGR